MKRTLALCRERTALVLAKPRFLSYRSAPSPRLHPMNFSSIRAAAKTQRAEEWFWRVVFVGVVCDFLYLGWLALTSLRTKWQDFSDRWKTATRRQAALVSSLVDWKPRPSRFTRSVNWPPSS